MPVYKLLLLGVSADMPSRTHAGFTMSSDVTEEAPICCGALDSRLHDPNQPRNLHSVVRQWSLAHDSFAKQRLAQCR